MRNAINQVLDEHASGTPRTDRMKLYSRTQLYSRERISYRIQESLVCRPSSPSGVQRSQAREKDAIAVTSGVIAALRTRNGDREHYRVDQRLKPRVAREMENFRRRACLCSPVPGPCLGDDGAKTSGKHRRRIPCQKSQYAIVRPSEHSHFRRTALIRLRGVRLGNATSQQVNTFPSHQPTDIVVFEPLISHWRTVIFSNPVVESTHLRTQ
jgi:hypothetical protein